MKEGPALKDRPLERRRTHRTPALWRDFRLVLSIAVLLSYASRGASATPTALRSGAPKTIAATQQTPLQPTSESEDVAALRVRAEQGNAEAQTNLGDAYWHGRGVPNDSLQAVGWWRKAADQGYAPAQFHLGMSYAFGEGVLKDVAQAAAWWRKAAEQGDWRAQNWLGVAYANGQGVPRDAAEATRWQDLAAAGPGATR